MKKSLRSFSLVFLSLILLGNLLMPSLPLIVAQEEEPLDEAGPPAGEAGARLFEQVDPTVVAIQHERAGGSGFIISPDGYILTNGHVVSGAGSGEEDPKATAKRITVITSQEKKYQARVIGHCLDPDVALIKIEPEEPLPIVKLGNSDEVKTGQKAYAFGMPMGLKRTLTAGIISNIERTDLGTFTKVIQTDAPINPGNSGGPLFNEKGEVLGLNTYGGRGESLGFTIPINVAKVLRDHFLKYGYFRRAALPLFIPQPLYDELSKTLGVKEGIHLDYVEPDSPAAKAGLLTGDVIIGLNDQPVLARTEAQLKDFIWKVVTQEIGTTIKLKILRPQKGAPPEELTISAKLVEDEPAVEYGFQIGEIKELRYDDIGLGVKRMTRLTYYLYDLPKYPGVRITRVKRATPAFKSDLGKNDLITHLDQMPISSAEQFQKEFEKRLAKCQKYICLTIRRGNEEIRTALKPSYDLAGKKIALILPPKDMEYFELIKRFFTVTGAEITIARRTKADVLLKDLKVTDFDGLVFVGGPGAKSYWQDEEVYGIVKKAVQEKKVLGAIGAASLILINAETTLLEKKITTDKEYSKIALEKKANYTGNDVERDGNIVTTTGFDARIIKSFLRKFRTALHGIGE